MNKKSICFVAGRSGGHIIPGLTLATQFTQKNPDYNIIFFTSNTKLDQSIIFNYPNINTVINLELPNFPRLNILKYPKFIWLFFKSFYISFQALWEFSPEKVISMGGYISIPVCLSAWILQIPIELFELNAVPGTAIKFLRPFATKIFVCFSEAQKFFKKSKVEIAAYPIRFDKKIDKSEACHKLNLNSNKKILFICGGSQGSGFINKLLIKFVETYPNVGTSLQIIHQTGSSDKVLLEEIYKKNNIDALVFDYRHDLDVCYCAADLVIARAGAGTLFELVFFEKQSIIIPLETKTTNHQIDNALAMVDLKPKLFHVLIQNKIDKEQNKFFGKIIELLQLQTNL